MTEREIGVHNSHCCVDHGCKYGDDDCPVVLGKVPGIYCEQCEDERNDYAIEASYD